jgi:hypothetical protein
VRLTVAWKLGQRQPHRLSCVAEELAAHALLVEAEAVLDEEGAPRSTAHCMKGSSRTSTSSFAMTIASMAWRM